ncbi:hypothetical protein E4T80_00185 [Muribacter muris]|uniref:Pyridoxamine 5'-phosphate oxidase putative domain-containing protein n=2 Tax=Muribacter muris TaxID=67855 RepID=A0A4Y9K5N8_9PAST|nr:hypothetical protein [Muribacter muris]MBF0826397.1 hypothetical protein [Muribacter muris]TFV13421.1 hypothetical protein E4T80_00185 [Muribacter muris]
MPHQIAQFIHRHHVVSLACQFEGHIWCASCFYIFDEYLARLIILTKRTTYHGQLMLKNPHIAGTISAQPDNIREIEGIQFRATARYLSDSVEEQKALARYLMRFPVAKQLPSDVWEIAFNEIKHTQNMHTFAEKTIWQKENKMLLDSDSPAQFEPTNSP